MGWNNCKDAKTIARYKASGAGDRKKPFQKCIVLPSLDLGCLHTMLRERTITPQTELYCAEYDKEKQMQVLVNVADFAIKNRFLMEGVHFHQDDIATLELRKHSTKTDLAFIDLCGNVNEHLIEWVRRQLVPNLDEDSTVSFTVSTTRSPGPWMSHRIASFPDKYPRIFARCEQEWPQETPYLQKLVATYLTMFRQILFHNFTYTEDVYPYIGGEEGKKGMRMVVLKFKNLRRKKA